VEVVVAPVVVPKACGSIQGGCGTEKDPLLPGSTVQRIKERRWKGIAWWACWLSILWNTAEGGFAVYFGLQAHQIALFIFGSQSLIEILAAALVLYRFNLDNDSSGAGAKKAGNVERLGSRAVGVCLILLSAYALGKAIMNLVNHAGPDSSTYGIIVAGISALAMFAFWILKDRAAKVLKSPVLASDAKCSQMCMCLGSLVVVSSVLFLLDDNLWWVDSACTIVLALKFAKDGVNVVKVSYAEDFEGGCGCCA